MKLTENAEGFYSSVILKEGDLEKSKSIERNENSHLSSSSARQSVEYFSVTLPGRQTPNLDTTKAAQTSHYTYVFS